MRFRFVGGGRAFLSSESLTDFFVLLCVYAFLFYYFTPSLLFSDTVTTGGDMGSHYVLAKFMSEELLPSGRLIGWYPNWFGGIPAFQYYFIPPYLFMTFLSYLIPFNVAFKVGTVFGVFLLPLAAFFSLKLMGFGFPAPVFAALSSVCFLFMEGFNIRGGNIPSVLAGQFANSWSFAFLVLFFGLFYRGISDVRRLLGATLSLVMVVMCHIYLSFVAFAAMLFFAVKKGGVFKVFGVCFFAFVLNAFWSVPFVQKISYSTASEVEFYVLDLWELVPPAPYQFTLVLALLCVLLYVGGFFKGVERSGVGYLVYLLFATCLMVVLWSWVVGFNFVRFIPVAYFLMLLLCAVLFSWVAARVRERCLFTVLVMLVVFAWVGVGVDFFADATHELTGYDLLNFVRGSEYFSHGLKSIPPSIRWNYEGLEAKPGYGVYMALTEYMQGLGDGRFDAEYYNYGFLGTPRVFEASPVFSGKPIMEGLLFESSLTYPFFFYIQKCVSETSWWPGFEMSYPDFNMEYGLRLLRLYNVKYFVAYSQKAKTALDALDGADFLESFDGFRLYGVNEGSQYVEAIIRKPVLVVTDDYRSRAYEWITIDRLDTLLVFRQNPDEYDLRNFEYMIVDKPYYVSPEDNIILGGDMVDSLLTVGGYDGVCNVTEDMRGDELFFETDCVGRPHLVKIPYFPNWRVEGAERIYLVSPALMMVIPEKAKVHIYYGVEFADTLGWVITFVGVIFLLYLLSGRIKFVKTRLHDKVSKWLEKWGFNGFFGFFEGRFSRHLVFCFSFVRANFLRVLAIVFAVAVLSAASFLFFSQSRCDGFCRQTDFEHGTYNLEDKVDYVRFGQNHADDMKSHKAGYDGAAVRDDFMYLQNGYLEFKTSVVPNTENILRLRMLDDISCRSGSLYVDGVFLARLRSSGSYSGWKDFPIKMKPEDSSDGKVTVRLTSDDPRCFGWDIMEAEVLVDECSCFSEQ